MAASPRSRTFRPGIGHAAAKGMEHDHDPPTSDRGPLASPTPRSHRARQALRLTRGSVVSRVGNASHGMEVKELTACDVPERRPYPALYDKRHERNPCCGRQVFLLALEQQVCSCRMSSHCL